MPGLPRLAPIACVILLLTGSAAAQRVERPVPVDLELVLAIDISGSIDEEEARLQRQGYIDAITDPEIIRAIRGGILRRIAVTYFEWSGDGYQDPVIGWTLIDGLETARAFAAELDSAPLGTGPWTSISDAIDFGARLFAGNGFEGTRRIIDISGDGPNNTGGPVTPARDQAVASGLTINGLPIMNDRPTFSRIPMPNLDLYYRHCVIGGRGAFIVVAKDFRTFARAIRRKMILEIAGRAGGKGAIGATGLAQILRGTGKSRWVPPCDEGEKRFRGWIGEDR
ncbi:MAG: DUF1194 domain-containing protein [Alphaproteobacteria bacterium]